MAKRYVDYDKLEEGDIILNQGRNKIYFVLEKIWMCQCKCKVLGYLFVEFDIQANECTPKKKFYLSDFNQTTKKRQLLFRVGDEKK